MSGSDCRFFHRRARRLAAAFLIALFMFCSAGCGGDNRDVREPVGTGLLPLLAAGAIHDDRVDVGHDACAALLGAGWHGSERTTDGMTYAWSREPSAFLTLVASAPVPGVLRLRCYGLADPVRPRRCEVLVNGFSLGEQVLRTGMGHQEWAVPPHRMRAGANEVELRVDRVVSPRELGLGGDKRPLGVLVDQVEFVPTGSRAVGRPYVAGISTELAPGRRLQTLLSHPAGAALSLAWTGAAAPRIRFLGSPGGETLREVTPAPGDSEVVITVPVDFAGSVWLEIAGGAGMLTEATLEREVDPVDIVLIVIDTLRPDYLGCYGGQATPGIDELAADGLLFAQAYCQTPITGPSHTSLFTSRLPSETGVLNNARGKIPSGMPTFAEILAQSGWQARAAVAIGNVRRSFGFARGFNQYNDRMDGGWILAADVVGPRIDAQRRALTTPGLLFAHYADPHEPYDAHGLVERSAELLVDGKVRTVFATSTYTPLLVPLDLPVGETTLTIRSQDPFHIRSMALRRHTGDAVLETDYNGMVAVTAHSSLIRCSESGRADLALHVADRVGGLDQVRERYGREVAYVDRWVGALLDSLRVAGRYDESLIIFTADHGESLGEHGELGHVENLYGPMNRVPLIIKPPQSRGFSGGTRRHDLAALVDVLPTMLAVVGIPALPTARGRDLLAAGAAEQDVFVFVETHRPEAQRDLYGVRTATGLVVSAPENATWEYYDLVADPGETVNIARDGEPAFERHRSLLRSVLGQLDPAAVRDHGEAVVDERTAEMLRSLGY